MRVHNSIVYYAIHQKFRGAPAPGAPLVPTPMHLIFPRQFVGLHCSQVHWIRNEKSSIELRKESGRESGGLEQWQAHLQQALISATG